MSLCMAAACESGKYAVVGCDGRVVFGKQAADVFAPKMQWITGKVSATGTATKPLDWLFMFAGNLSSTELVMEQVRYMLYDDGKADPLSRRNIQGTLVRAFHQRAARWGALRHLSMFGIDMETFWKEGRNSLGDKLYARFVDVMYKDAITNLRDEILVVGWGKEPLAVMLYSASLQGDNAGAKDASYAIGSGRDRALSTLAKLNHGLFSSLHDTIYCVAAAKFSAESKSVGKDTALYVVHKRIPQDNPDELPQVVIDQDSIAELKAVWKKHKGRGVPVEAKRIAARIVELTGDKAAISRGARDILMDELGRATRRLISRKAGRP